MSKYLKIIWPVALSVIMAVVFIVRIEGRINVTDESIKNIKCNHKEFRVMVLKQNNDIIDSIKGLNKTVCSLDRNVLRLKVVLENGCGKQHRR